MKKQASPEQREIRRAMLVGQYISMTGQAPPPIDHDKRARLEQLGRKPDARAKNDER